MRIDKVEIKNYRQYKKLEFSFPKTSLNDLHIIIGSNGVGKTNLLNAITWCFYGIEPHLGIESKALPIVNLETLKKMNEGDICEIEVSIQGTDNEKPIIFRRKQKIRYSGKNDPPFKYKDVFSFTIINDDGSDIVEDKEAVSYVNRYVPERIREYFFFDGEQLDEYFIGVEGDRIKKSIYEISQVQLLSQIGERLDKVKRELQREAGKKNSNIDELNSQSDFLEKQIEETEKTIKELKDQIDKSEKIMKKKTEYIKGQEDVTDLEEKLQELKKEKLELDKERAEINIIINKFICEYNVLLTLYPYISRTLDIIKEKEKNGLLPPNIDKAFLEKMLDKHTCLICNRPLSNKENEEIESLLEQIKISSKTSHLLVEIKNDLLRKKEYAELYTIKKNELANQRKKVDEKIKINSDKATKISNKLLSYTDKEKLINAINERNRHEKLLEENTKRLGVQENNLIEIKKDLEGVNNKIAKAISMLAEQTKLQNLVKLSQKARSVAIEIEDEMMIEVRDNIRQMTLEIFNKLIWKKNTYKDINIDDNYNIDLIHKEGYSCIGSCSAAERALLALSFTLALHRVSGFDSPLVIDTPVSRVSDVNRTNFSEVLKDVSNEKQIIMLFTPSEYSDEVKNIFGSVANTITNIATDDEIVAKIV